MQVWVLYFYSNVKYPHKYREAIKTFERKDIVPTSTSYKSKVFRMTTLYKVKQIRNLLRRIFMHTQVDI